MKKAVYYLLFILLLASLLNISCGAGPSETQIESAIKVSLEGFIPVKLANSMGGGRYGKVDDLQILDIGKVQQNGEREYWPVKIYAEGSCSVPFKNRTPFKGETTYKVYQDDFGEWRADHTGGWNN